MALVVNDRVKETSTTTGTGTFSLAGAVSGFETFVAGIGNSNTTFYSIVNTDGAFEVGVGTVTDATPDTLSRDTILSSSNSDSAVDFAAGTKQVFCTLPASRFVPGKFGGTNFTNSILIGHATTGTLNAAEGNTGVGIQTLDALSSGDDNTAVGKNAGTSINSGIRNSIVGSGAGDAITDGDQNTAIGFNSLTNNTSSDKNTSVGAYSLENATGGFNIGIGKSAGGNITSGAGNIIIGSDINADSATGNRQLKIAGYDGTTTTTWISGDNSGNLTFAGTATADSGKDVILGKLEGTDFTGSLLVGHNTTGTLSSAENNTGVGVGALDALSSGDRNTALGHDAGTAITTANNSTLLGFEAGKGITGANMNVAIGDSALAGSNTDSNSASNTVVGAFAMNVSSGAKENTAIGRDAGREITTGDSNILIGYNAGANDSSSGITTGSGNVIIGTVDPDSRTANRQLKIAGNDGTTTTTWIKGDNTGQLTISGAYTLPASDGSANQVLTTDGSGAVTFQTPTTGDITGVTAGSGLTGGGASGDVTLNVGAGTGIDVTADAIAVDVSDFMTNGSNNRVVTATGTDGQNAEANLTFDGSTLDVTGTITFDGGSTSADLNFGDNDKAVFGAGNDLEIFHDGSNSNISDVGTGQLVLRTDGTQVAINKGSSENMAKFITDGAVELYHDNSKKFETTSAGVTVTGAISATSLDADGGITVDNITIDGTEIDLSSGDLTIDVAGDITLDAGGSDIRFDAGGSEYGKLNLSGNNLNIHSSINDADIVLKGEDGGSTITALTLDMSDAGTATFNNGVRLNDNNKLTFGNDNDFEIYFDPSNGSIIREAGAANLVLAGNDVQITNGAMNETHIDCNNNGSVDLFHNNVKKLETTSTGIDVTGEVLADKAYIAEATLTDGATINWDMSTQSVAKVTLGGNRTLAAPTNSSTGQFCSINVIQDGTGGRTLTWNAVFEFADDTAPTLTSTASKGDLFVFRYNGSKWLEVGRNLNISQS